MRMTYTSFMQFYENVDMSMLWSICHRGGTKGVPRQLQQKWCHGKIPMIRQLIEIPVQKSKCADVRNMQKMVGWSRLPGVPHVGGMETRNAQATTGTQCKREHLIQQSIRSTDVVSGYTFEACLLKRIKFVEGSSGSSGSQVGEEVVVHVP